MRATELQCNRERYISLEQESVPTTFLALLPHLAWTQCRAKGDLMRTSGEMYCLSEAPFMVNGQLLQSRSFTGRLLFWPTEAWAELQAGAAEVWIGGRPYHTQANGPSSPYCLQPGQRARVRLIARGNAHIFSILEVEGGS